VSEYRGEVYAGRNPGLAFVALAFLRITTPLAPLLADIRLDPAYAGKSAGHARTLARLMLLPPLVAGALFLLLVLTLRSFGTEELASIFLAAGFLLSTLTLRYATVLYSHDLTAALVTGALLLFVKHRREGSRRPLVFASFLLAYAVVCEPLALFLSIPVLLYLAADGLRALAARLPPLALGAAVPAFLLMAYNAACFDSPFAIAYFHHATYLEVRSVTTTFDPADALSRCATLLLDGGRFTGVFSHSPALVLSVLATVLVIARPPEAKSEHALYLSAFLWALAPLSFYVMARGGWDEDYRLMLFGLPGLLPALALPLSELRRARSERLRRAGSACYLMALSALFAIGAGRQLAHVRHELQVPYETHLPNLLPALVNTLPVALAGIALVGGRSLLRRRRQGA
jgi:hypothetical protein